MNKKTFVIASILLLLSALTAFSQMPKTLQWEYVGVKSGSEDAIPSLYDMVGTLDGTILVDRGGSYVDIIDTFGNIKTPKLLSSNKQGWMTKFIVDNDTIYYVKNDVLYIYNDGKLDFYKNLPKNSENLDINNGIFYYTYKELGIHISFDKGDTWEIRGNGIKIKEGRVNNTPKFVVTSHNIIYLHIPVSDKITLEPIGSLFVSDDYGENWVETEITNVSVVKMFKAKNTAFIYTIDGFIPEASTHKIWRANPQTPIENIKFDDFTPDMNPYFPGFPLEMYNFGKNSPPSTSEYAIIGVALYGLLEDKMERIDDKDPKKIYKICAVNGSFYGWNATPFPSRIVKLNNTTKKWDVLSTDPKVVVNSFTLFGVYGDTLLVNARLPSENYSGLMISPDNGNTWEKLPNPNPLEFHVGDLAPLPKFNFAKLIDDKMYVSLIGNGFIVSENRGNGKYYRQVFEDLNVHLGIALSTVNSFFVHENNMLLCTNVGVFISRDKGKEFYKCSDPKIDFYIQQIKHNKGRYYLKKFSDTLYCSKDFGDTWEPFLIWEQERSLQDFDFTEDGAIFNFGGAIDYRGSYFIKNEDIGDKLDLYSDKLIRMDSEEYYYADGSSAQYRNSSYAMVIDTHLVAINTLNGLFYRKLSEGSSKAMRVMTSQNMGFDKILTLDTNSKYIFASQSSGIFRCPRPIQDISTVEEIPQFVPVLLYPNPGSDFVNIILNNAEEYRYVILDNTGREVGSGTIENNKIDIRAYPIGSYLIKVSSRSDSFSTKFIKR